jgi:protein ImuB
VAPARALVALCPDWAVIAAGRPPSAKVAVLSANRVVATSPAARSDGVQLGLRRREAQSRCPGLEVLPSDLVVEARCWEPAVAAVELSAPGVEVLQPGSLALAVRGPSRYFGGDLALAAKVAATVEAVVSAAMGDVGEEDVPGAQGGWTGCCHVGVADSLFAAGLAAQLAVPGMPLVVAPGGSSEFLAPLPIRVLGCAGGAHGAADDRPSPVPSGPTGLTGLADLLVRLGIRTLGDFSALPASSVLARFGMEGLRAHRSARGLADRPVSPRASPPDWTVAAELDPPADQLHAAAFAGKALADELHARLAATGLVCTRLAIQVETGHGERLRRSWRHDGALSAGAIGERVRWQLEGWAQAMGTTAGVTKLVLVPEEVRPDDGRQLGLWANDVAAGDRAVRAGRALARVQGLLGPEKVLVAVLQGGRDYAEQVRLVPWGEAREPLHPGGSLQADGTEAGADGAGAEHGAKANRKPSSRQVEVPSWPGRLPGPAHALVHQPPVPAQVTDIAGNPVCVTNRCVLSGPPAWLAVDGARPLAIESWAGPWPLEERWWDGGGRRRARLQVCVTGGAAYLIAREKGSWWLEGTYD